MESAATITAQSNAMTVLLGIVAQNNEAIGIAAQAIRKNTEDIAELRKDVDGLTVKINMLGTGLCRIVECATQLVNIGEDNPDEPEQGEVPGCIPEEWKYGVNRIIKLYQTPEALLEWFRGVVNMIIATRKGSYTKVLSYIYKRYDAMTGKPFAEGKPQCHGLNYRKGGRAIQIFSNPETAPVLVCAALMTSKE